MPRLDWLRDEPFKRVVYIYDGPGFMYQAPDGAMKHVDCRGRVVQFDEAGAPFVVGPDEVRYYIPIFHRRITSLDEL